MNQVYYDKFKLPPIERRETLYILIIGADGTGKSTLTGNLSSTFKNTLGIVPKTLHYNIWTKERKPLNEDIRLYESAPRRILPQLLFTFLKFVLYFFFLKKLRANGSTLIQERGWFDQTIDPARYRLSSKTNPLIEHLSKLLPDPDIIIALVGDPIVIANRKNEQTPYQVEEINRKILNLNLPNIVYFDVTKISQHELTAMIFDSIKTKMVYSLFQDSKHTLLPSRLQAISSSNSRSLDNLVYRPRSLIGKMLRKLHILMPRVRDISNREAVLFLFNYLIENNMYPDKWILVASSKENRNLGIIELLHGPQIIVKFSKGPDHGLRNELKMLMHLRKMELRTFEVPKLFRHEFTEEFDLLAFFADKRVNNLRPISISKASEIAKEIAKLNVCHGDFAWWNIAHPNLVLDWENASIGDNVKMDQNRFIESLAF